MHNYDAQLHRAGQIISPLALQTITIAQMLSDGGKGANGGRLEEIAFENDRISDSEMLVTLTLDRVILHLASPFDLHLHAKFH